MPKKPTETVKDLKPHPRNPRKIKPEDLQNLGLSMEEFGDMGGIVRNQKTGRMISGHQRHTHFPDNAPIVILERLKRPSRAGTVAYGYIEHQGDRFAFREVLWDEVKEDAAMIAANRHGGDWDLKVLSGLVSDLDQQNYPGKLFGFSESELEDLLAPLQKSAANISTFSESLRGPGYKAEEPRQPLPLSAAARVEAAKTMIEDGYLTPDQAKEALGIPLQKENPNLQEPEPLTSKPKIRCPECSHLFELTPE